MGIAMRADAKFGEKPGGLQAPFVFRDATRFVIDDWFIAALLPGLKGIHVSHLTWEMSAEPSTAK